MGTSWYVGGAEGLTRPWAGPLGRSRHSAAESSTAPKRPCFMGHRDFPAESVCSHFDRQCMKPPRLYQFAMLTESAESSTAVSPYVFMGHCAHPVLRKETFKA